ncbi:MAG: hypothetical protein CVV27_11460, partial [Candidatus Melainabacteria bacterium HGW-Melainabacteria-1]
MNRKRIAIACGGTGGHIYPGLTLGEKLQQNGLEVFFMGSNQRMEKDVIPAAGYDFVGLPVKQTNKRRPLQTLLNWAQCAAQARSELKRRSPLALVGLGSYITVPSLLAARQLGIPIYLVETNVVPGKANQFLGRLANWVALAHPQTAPAFGKTPTHVTGSPVRPGFALASRSEGAAAFGLNPDAPVLSVIGGSQGAQIINEALVRDLPRLLSLDALQIVHVCGASNHDQIRAQTSSYAGHPRYRLLNYVENMPSLLATSDLALSRAGASMIAELMACQVPTILVPGRFGGGHQLENAQLVAQAGAGILLEEPQMQEGALFQL